MTKLALALVRPEPLRFRLPAASLRVVLGLGAVVSALALGYAGLGGAGVFAVEEIEVSGAPPEIAAEVRAAAAPVTGTSLARLDGDELVARLRALPSVRDVEYDRAFPATLRIVVRAERPVAVVRLGEVAWLTSERGRVLREVEPGTLGRLPRVWAAPEAAVGPGDTVASRDVRLALRALAALPERFPVRAVSARAGEDGLVVVLAGGGEVRLGAGDALALKLAAAARVLGTLPADERGAVVYVDASLPDRVVVAGNPQVEG